MPAFNPTRLAKALKKAGQKGSVRANKKKIVKSRAGKNPKGPPRNAKLSKKEKEGFAKAMSKKRPGARAKALGTNLNKAKRRK